MAMISSGLGLSGEEFDRIKLTSHLPSTTAIDKTNAEPHVGGHVASQGVGLHCDHWQFLAHCAVSSLGKTHFQIPCGRPSHWAAILARDDEVSSGSNLNSCANQLDSPEANDPPGWHLG